MDSPAFECETIRQTEEKQIQQSFREYFFGRKQQKQHRNSYKKSHLEYNLVLALLENKNFSENFRFSDLRREIVLLEKTLQQALFDWAVSRVVPQDWLKWVAVAGVVSILSFVLTNGRKTQLELVCVL